MCVLVSCNNDKGINHLHAEHRVKSSCGPASARCSVYSPPHTHTQPLHRCHVAAVRQLQAPALV